MTNLKIDKKSCISCSACYELCRFIAKAITKDEDKFYIDIEKCIDCKKCINVCPSNSIY